MAGRRAVRRGRRSTDLRRRARRRRHAGRDRARLPGLVVRLRSTWSSGSTARRSPSTCSATASRTSRRDASYSLFEQADLVEALLAQLGVRSCALVGSRHGHDRGRRAAGAGEPRCARLLGRAVSCCSTARSSSTWRSSLAARRLGLLARGRRMPISFPRPFLRRNLRESVAPGTNLGPEQVEDLVDLIRLDGGDRLLTRQINYIRERRVHQEAWTAAFVEFPGTAQRRVGRARPDRGAGDAAAARLAAPGHRRGAARRRRTLALDRGARRASPPRSPPGPDARSSTLLAMNGSSPSSGTPEEMQN